MRILGILATLLAIVFYLGKIIRMLTGGGSRPVARRNNESIASRLQKAKPAQVIDVKTVVTEKDKGN